MERPSNRFATVIFFLCGLYGLFVAWILLIKFLVGESLPIVALFNTFLHLLLMPATLFLVLALIARRWIVALMLLPTVAFFLISYGPRFLPHQISAQGSSGTTNRLKVLTYNLHAEQNNLDGIIQIIRNSNADIINLQEVSKAAASRFSSELISEYPYQAAYPQGYANAGQAILSRFQIQTSEYWRSNWPPDALGHERAVISFGGEAIIIYNTHPLRPIMDGLSFDDTPRNEEIQDVLNRAAQETSPVLIMGDFNMSDQTEDYLLITRTYQDTYREVGWGMGPTFPDSDPNTASTNVFGKINTLPLLLRLDYIFHSQQFVAVASHVWPTSGGSDHHPVYAELVVITN
jgi:vancomycin resistance protein VanJ